MKGTLRVFTTSPEVKEIWRSITRIESGGPVGPISEGAGAVTDWTELTYAVVDIKGNVQQQPPDLIKLAIVPIVDVVT